MRTREPVRGPVQYVTGVGWVRSGQVPKQGSSARERDREKQYWRINCSLPNSHWECSVSVSNNVISGIRRGNIQVAGIKNSSTRVASELAQITQVLETKSLALSGLIAFGNLKKINYWLEKGNREVIVMWFVFGGRACERVSFQVQSGQFKWIISNDTDVVRVV